MPTFDINRPNDVLRLDGSRKGSIPFVVTNVTTRAIKAFLEVIPANPADKSSFTIEGGPERNLRPNQGENVRVLIAAPASAAPGSHKFLLKVSDDAEPNERFNESQSVEFTLPDTEVKTQFKFPWWLIPAGAILILCVAAGGYYVHEYPSIPNYRTQNKAVAVAGLEAIGMKVASVKNVMVNDPSQDNVVVTQSVGGVPLKDGQRVKRGSEIRLEVAGRVPHVAGLKIQLARSELSSFAAGLLDQDAHTPTSDPEFVDRVASQDPDPEDPKRPLPDKIRLTVYIKQDQPPPPPAPELVTPPIVIGIGMQYCQAAYAIEDAGLVPKPAPIPIGNMVNGLVVGQSVLPPAKVPKQTPVVLTFQGIPAGCRARVRSFQNWAVLLQEKGIVSPKLNPNVLVNK